MMDNTFVIAPFLVIITWAGIVIILVVAGIGIARWAVRKFDKSGSPHDTEQ